PGRRNGFPGHSPRLPGRPPPPRLQRRPDAGRVGGGGPLGAKRGESVDQRDTSERNGDLNQSPADMGRDDRMGIGGWLAQYVVSLIAAAAVITFVCIKLDPMTVGLVAVGLGLVIFIHELGHFVAAKWCDVHVETFSIGFGPPLPGCRFRRGETVYQIALI